MRRTLAIALLLSPSTALRTPPVSLREPKLPQPPPIFQPRAVAGLAIFGGAAGPLVDAVHNQCLLAYDVLPITLQVGFTAKTSLLIPPLLALTYALLGSVLPAISERIVGSSRAMNPPAASLSPRARAALAVASTVFLIKSSELLTLSALPSSASLSLLLAGCLIQWASLDGALASLVLASIVAIGGPLAEIPFIAGGCWHYIDPTYFPLEPWLGPVLGLSPLTGPCYFAVTYTRRSHTQHRNASLARWLSDSHAVESRERAQNGCDRTRAVASCGR